MKPSRYLVFLSMGFELVGLILGSLYLGQILDEKFGTRGLILIALTLCCLVSWMVHLVFLLKRIEKAEARDAEKKSQSF